MATRICQHYPKSTETACVISSCLLQASIIVPRSYMGTYTEIMGHMENSRYACICTRTMHTCRERERDSIYYTHIAYTCHCTPNHFAIPRSPSRRSIPMRSPNETRTIFQFVGP